MKKEKLYEGIFKIKKDLKNILDLKKDKNYVILVSGGSASGKTSPIAKKIAKLYEKDSILLSMDNYYRWEKYVLENWISFDDPSALDLDLFFKHLKNLKSWKKIDSPIYDFKKSKRSDETISINPKKVIIVEGLYALCDKLVKLWDYKIFVDLWTHGRILRRLFRDIKRTWQTPSEILDYFSTTVEPKNTQYIEPSKKHADTIVMNKYIPFIEARNSDIKETQIKFNIKGFKTNYIWEIIHSLWWFFVWEIEDKDYFLSSYSKNLSEEDEIMRIRCLKWSRYLFSYRWPKVKGLFYEKRYWINFFIDSDTFKSFKDIYWKSSKIIEKTRHNYFLNGFIISIDEFFEGDKYMDIRFSENLGMSFIKPFLKKLNLDYKNSIKKSYFEIIR